MKEKEGREEGRMEEGGRGKKGVGRKAGQEITKKYKHSISGARKA